MYQKKPYNRYQGKNSSQQEQNKRADELSRNSYKGNNHPKSGQISQFSRLIRSLYQRFLSVDDLIKLNAFQNVNEIINHLDQNQQFFQALEKTDRKKIKRPFEFLSQIYNIIKQISDSLQENSQNSEARFQVIQFIRSDNIQHILSDFIQNIENHFQRIDRQQLINFYTNIILSYHKLMNIIKSDTKYLQLDQIISSLKLLIEFDRNSYEKLLNFAEQIQEIQHHNRITIIREEQTKKNKNEEKKEEEKQNIYRNVPITFRDQSIVPTAEEFFFDIQAVNMRPNRVKGNYISPEFYIQNQFYLLREDFIKDFRNSVHQLIENGIQNIHNDIKQTCYFYDDCQLQQMTFQISGMYFLIKMKPMYINRNYKIDWDNQKRLINGSFLVITNLSSTEPKKFVHFAIIKEKSLFKNMNKLNSDFEKTGTIEIVAKILNYDNLQTILGDLTNTKLFIIESKAYYEKYQHFLLKLHSTQIEEIPFRNNLIDMVQQIDPPRYLNRVNAIYQFNLSLLKGQGQNFNVQILQNLQWPKKIQGTLDDSQFKALKQILTKEIALIQGPPGTGKTYVGAMAVKYHMNQTSKIQSPILIICQTNHALDQFLKHIMPFTDKIIRIGGRCEDEEIQKFLLQNKRDKNVKNPEFGKLKYKIIPELEKIANQLFKMILHENLYDTCQNLIPEFMMKYDREVENLIIQQYTYQLQQNYGSSKIQLIQYNYGLNFIKNNVKNWKKELFEQSFMKNQYHQFDIYLQETEFIEIIIQFDEDIQQNQQTNQRKMQETQQEQQPDQEGMIEEDNENQFEDENYLLNRKLELGQDDNIYEIVNKFEKININLKPKYAQNLKQNRNNYKKLIKDNNFNRNNFHQFSHQQIKIIQDYVYSTIERSLYEKFETKYEKFVQTIQSLEESRIINDIDTMKTSHIIGMTLNGCAKYSKHISLLRIKIAIIEEASECLESEVFAVLTEYLEHLIMIGDHKQLKPQCNNYELQEKYNLNMSLFERLINNNLEFVYLQEQRRMRPEFADFIRLIYDADYKDHPDVNQYPDIRGIKDNHILIDYEGHYDNENANSTTKLNKYEGDYLVSLTQYFLNQDYKPQQITILSMYVGQTLYIRKQLKFHKIQGVRTATVDNYQGEESDIILLSLVRSNKELKLGFTRISNRINVAFSRARYGFYVIGNFKFIEDCELENKQKFKEYDSIWLKFLSLAKKRNIIKKQICLSCQNHKNETIVKNQTDFLKVPEGGCKQICNIRLQCGHSCQFFCHNFKHDPKECKQPCSRTFQNCNHPCIKACNQECGQCQQKIIVKLKCGHENKVICSQNLNDQKCKIKCNLQMHCGHECQKICHMYYKCDVKQCEVLVEKILICKHKQKIPCKQQPEEALCKEACKQVLECGHLCPGNCGDCLNGTMHRDCTQKCTKSYLCGHQCLQNCSRPCGICRKKCEYKCCYSICDKKCGQQCISCNNPCKYSCEHSKCTNLCKEKCNRKPCDEPCNKLLQCVGNKSQWFGNKSKHTCIGLCGEECLKICRICDQGHPIFDILFGTEELNSSYYKLQCGHIFEVKGLDIYMNMQVDNSVAQKSCPTCKQTITLSSRYSNLIKTQRSDIFKVNQLIIDNMLLNKQQQNQQVQKIKNLQNELLNGDQYIFLEKKTQNYLKNTFRLFLENLSKFDQDQQFELLQIINITNCIEIFIQIKKIQQEISQQQQKNFDNLHKSVFDIHLNQLQKYLIDEDYWGKQYSDRFMDDLNKKLQSMIIYIQLIQIQNQNSFTQQIIQKITEFKNNLFNQFFIFKSEQQEKDYKLQIKNYGTLSLQQIQEIIKVLGMQKGHWFKCPNGHFYCIGECGGAMEKSICPECKSEIGGSNHALVQGNLHASELDGSQYAAWSDQANMNNYHL